MTAEIVEKHCACANWSHKLAVSAIVATRVYFFNKCMQIMEIYAHVI